MESPKDDLTDIVLSITSPHIRRIIIAFLNQVTDERLQFILKSKTWEEFDDTITRLAARTLNSGHKLRLELHVCGSPSVELVGQVVPRFVEVGHLKVFRTLYIWAGSIPRYLFFSKRGTQFLLALISGPSMRR